MSIETVYELRDKGKFNVTIGTSLAVEVFTGKDEQGEDVKDPHPEVLLVNVRTVYRNIIQSVNAEVRDRTLPGHLIPVLVEDMTGIMENVNLFSNNKTKVVFYYCTYADLAKRFPNAIMKEMKTPLQKSLANLEEMTLNAFIKQYGETFEVQKYVSTLTGFSSASAWLLTHSPVELLSYKFFNSLILLESHTGKRKTRSQWNTKLTNGKELTMVPFNQVSLQIFGDNNLYFSGYPGKVRKDVLDIATANRWHAMTTKERMRFGLSGMKDHFTRSILLKMF